jgi:ElaB/YqjD/DUF883 family membrane-anchored ribosome-binding protein
MLGGSDSAAGFRRRYSMDQNEGATGTMTEGETAGTDGRFNRAKEYVSEKYGTASEAVKNRYTAVKEKIDEVDMGEVADKVRNYVRANPGKAMLMSVGVGFVIGLLLRRGGDED